MRAISTENTNPHNIYLPSVFLHGSPVKASRAYDKPNLNV